MMIPNPFQNIPATLKFCDHEDPQGHFIPSEKRRRNKTSEPSQRQVRKKARRAHAAGVKNAFKR
jgi:hypothetical protein